MDSYRYHQRGVSSDKAEVHKATSFLDKGLFENTFCKILPDVYTDNDDMCLISHSDTVGTKGVLAYLTWKELGEMSVWERLAQDAMVMNIDDMLASGCTGPFVVSNTITRNKGLIPGDVIAAIIRGNQDFVDMLNENGIECHYAGGETADVGDVVRTIDNGITASALYPKKEVLKIQIKPGHSILGLASYGCSTYEASYNSGISCNGLTSARHDVLHSDYKKYRETYDPSMKQNLVYSGSRYLGDEVDVNGKSMLIWDLLTSPTRTFAPVLKKIIQELNSHITGIVHNTGGAHTKVLNFAPDVEIIKDQLLPVPPVFKLIQAESGASWKEMYQVFNMGTRMELYFSDEKAAEDARSIAEEFKIDAGLIGKVSSCGPDKPAGAHIKHGSDWLFYPAGK
ncbi:MAG TPA: AIR synthase related protein [Saprospiraceae bacterium]|nr:AIR synthase related protein [Saprospiraceae bacterium]